MTKEQLISKLNDLEWEDFEVKEAKGEVPTSSWETVSAFANSAGGWLVFGVKQIGKTFEMVKMSNPEKIEQDFLNILRAKQKFNVSINPTCFKYNIDGHWVLGFYIPVSPQKPVYFNTQSNTFIRRGSADQKATQAEIDAMYRDQTFGTKTSEIAAGTGLDSINQQSLARYRDYMSRFNPLVAYNRYNDTDFLQKLRIMDGEQCTLGGLLFLGKREVIERFIPDFRIDLLEIPGLSYTNTKVRYTFRIDEYSNLWEYYFECMMRLKSKVDVQFKIGNEGFATDVSPGFDALREALVNMLMHADHFSPACPRVRIFTNRIEFYNPGGMPKPIEELRGKDISLPRNPIITKLFRVVKLAENAGFGLDNIEYNWAAYNQTKPEFDIDFDSVVVSFSMLNSNQVSEQVEQKTEQVEQKTEQVSQKTEQVEYKTEQVEYKTEQVEQKTEQVKYKTEQVSQKTEQVKPEKEQVSQKTEQVKPEKEQVTRQVSVLIRLMTNELYTTTQMRELVSVMHRPTFLYTYLKPCLVLGLIEMTQPNSPNSPTQKYKLTKKGLDYQSTINSETK